MLKWTDSVQPSADHKGEGDIKKREDGVQTRAYITATLTDSLAHTFVSATLLFKNKVHSAPIM